MSQNKTQLELPSVLSRKGLWRQVNNWLKDERWRELNTSEQSWSLYALYVSGSWTEAESWLVLWQMNLDLPEHAHVFFARCVALARNGEVEQARFEWIACWRRARLNLGKAFLFPASAAETCGLSSSQRALARGWLFQTQSFLQSQRARWGSASSWAEFAERESFLAFNPMLRALAADMLAHANVRRGFYAGAIRCAQLALACSRQIENRGVENAIRVSLACWQAERGEAPDASLRVLRSLLREKSFHDAYSQNVLLLEIARTQMLIGQFVVAQKSLQRVERNLGGVASRPLFRQRILLAQRRALLARLEGRPLDALVELEAIQSKIPVFEDSLRLEVLGQMIAACSEAGRVVPQEWLEQELHLTGRVNSQRALRTIARRNGIRSRALPELADRLGELIDKVAVASASQQVFKDIVDSDFPGLIGLHAVRNEENILFVMPGRSPVVLLTPAGVVVRRESFSPQLIILARMLAGTVRSKEDIFRAVWNRRYLPERDDANVYVLIRRLRNVLGDQSHLLRSGRDGYSLQAGFIVVRPHLSKGWGEGRDENKMALEEAKRALLSESSDVELPSVRLMDLMHWAAQHKSFGAEDWQQKAGISRPSACRDISKLVEFGSLRRMGRGRAARYVWVQSKDQAL